MSYQGVKLGFQALRFSLLGYIAQDVQPTQIGIGGTRNWCRRERELSVLRFFLDHRRSIAAFLISAILYQVCVKGVYVEQECFPLRLQVSKGHSYYSFSRQCKEFAKKTVESMH